jgi:hypothetical protein
LKFCASIVAIALLGLSSACGSKTAPTAPEGAASSPAPVATTAAASAFRIQEAEIEFEVPAGWQAEKRDERQYAVSTPDGKVTVIFMPVEDAAEAEKAAASFKEGKQGGQGEARKLANVKSGGAKKGRTAGGLPTSSEEGTADSGGAPQQWRIDVIEAAKPVVVYSQLDQRATESQRADFEKITKSIRKAG